jgi:hypothetical protein
MSDVRTTLTAPDGVHRAVITRRPDGFFQTAYERLDDTAVGGVGGMSDPFWRPDREDEITPSLDDAERRARATLGLDPA